MALSVKIKYRLRRSFAFALLSLVFCLFLYFNPSAYQSSQSESQTSEPKPSSVLLVEKQGQTDSILAKDVLAQLAVQPAYNGAKYYRKLFYDNWSIAADGCNMREAILKRDLKNLVLNGCKVSSGDLQDPYTGKTIHFVRGQQSSSVIQIDHVVALSNAWSTGAYAFSNERRYEISQDPLNLIAVDGPANQQKSDQDAASWLPSNQSFRCQYVARQIAVKYKYELWVTPSEKVKMQEILASCPEEVIPVSKNQ